MANDGKIRKDDLFDVNDIVKGLEAIQKEADALVKSFKDLGTEAKKINTAIKGADSFKKLSAETDKAEKNTKDLTAAQRDLLRIKKQTTQQTAKLENALSEENIELLKQRELNRRATAEAKKLAAAQLKGAKSTNTWTKAANSFAFKFNALGNIVANVASAAFRKFTQFVKGSIDALDEQVKAEASLQRALNGRVSVQQRIIQQAQNLQKVTLFGDEETIRAAALVAQFVDQEEAISKLLPLIQDFATAQGVSLNTAAQLITKTYASSTNALSRYGLSVEGAANSSERLESLTDALSLAFEGQAVTAADSDRKLTSLKNSLGDLQEAIANVATSSEGSGFIRNAFIVIKEDAENLTNFLNEKANPGLAEATKRSSAFFESIKGLGEDEQLVKLNEEINKYNGFAKQNQEIWKELERERKDANRKRRKEIEKIQEDIQKEFKFQTKIVDILNSEVEALTSKSGLEDEIVVSEEEQNRILREQQKIFDERLAAFREYRSMLRKVYESQKVENEDLMNQMIEDAELEIQLLLEEEEQYLASEERKKQAALDRINEEKRAEEQLRDIKKQIANETFNFISALNDRQLENLNARLQAGTISEEKAAEESLKIRQRQARFDKLQALFNIGINTYEAITKATAQTGVLSPAVIPGIIAIGALQTAAVLASPIPQFGEGGDIEGPSHSNGGVLINAEGGEYMINKHSVKKYRPLLEAINSDSLLRGIDYNGGEVDSKLYEEQRKTNDLLSRINRKPVASSTMTSSGVLTAVTSGNSVNKKMKRYFK